VTNVANGISSTDAVNLGQLNTFSLQTRDNIRRVEGGVAMALAASTVNLPLEEGEMGLVGGVGVFRGETGFAFKYQARPSRSIVIGLNGGVTTRNADFGGAVAIGYKW